MSRPAVLVLSFVVTLGLVLGAAAAGGSLAATDGGAEEPPEIENEQYLDEDLPKDRAPGTADVTMDADVEPQTIVIDPGIEASTRRPAGPRIPFVSTGFGPDTTQRDILPLVNTLIENGHNVQIYTPSAGQEGLSRPAPPGAEQEKLTPLGRELADADAFVTFRTEYDDDQLDEIRNFSRADGRVIMATEPADNFDQPGAADFRATLNVTSEPGYVYNMEDNDLNFQRIFAEPADGTGLTAGVDRAVFPTATPVATMGTPDSQLLPTAGAQLSTSRAETDQPVMVRDGDVVIVGDTNFLSPVNAQRADNDVLIGNLADFLVTNDRTPSEQPPQPPEPADETPGGGTGPFPPGNGQTPPDGPQPEPPSDGTPAPAGDSAS
jgi:hypothetical protein